MPKSESDAENVAIRVLEYDRTCLKPLMVHLFLLQTDLIFDKET